jgi:K+-transporting ATPase ATPase C chain
MREHLKTALLSLALFTLLTGVAYPLALTGAARLLWPKKSRAVDTDLIGQAFDHPGYFWGRLSAIGYASFDAEKLTGSSGSNLGPLNPALREAAEARVKALGVQGPVPVDLVTASASGLDPHISPEAAEIQIARVARARGVDEATVREVVRSRVEPRTWGVLGEPRVNVPSVNRELDRRFGKPR